MSSQSFANLANSEFNGNIILKNGYIQFPNGSQQTTAGGSGGGNVSTTTINTYTNTSVNNFEDAEITCATQLNSDNSTLVANTEFVQTRVGTVGQFPNGNFGLGNNNYLNLTTGNTNYAYGNGALQNITIGELNNCIGEDAGTNITTGSGNNCIGYQSLVGATSGSANVSVGSNNLLNSNGSYNVAIGNQAGEFDTGLSSNNIYLGNSASPTDTHSYQYLTLIGSNSQPVIQGLNSQIVLGSTTGGETVYIPNTSLQFGVGNTSVNYNIVGSGNDSSIRLLCNDTTGTTQSTIVANYTESIFYSETNLFVQGLVSANLGLIKEVTDGTYSSQNGTIYWNGNNSVPQTQQLRVNLGGTLYYINLTAV